MNYRNFVRRTGLIDIGLFAVLALPYLSTYVLGLLFALGGQLGDARIQPDLGDPFVMLTINLIGVFGLFTAWLRVTEVTGDYGRPIGILKLFAAGLFGLSVVLGAPIILLIFVLVDAITGMQLLLKHKSAALTE